MNNFYGNEYDDQVVKDEVLYTYDAAVNKYERERYHSWLCRQRKLIAIKEKQKEFRRYMINQKLIGIISFLLILTATVIDGNLACLILCVPCVFAIITKHPLIVNDFYMENGYYKYWER